MNAIIKIPSEALLRARGEAIDVLEDVLQEWGFSDPSVGINGISLDCCDILNSFIDFLKEQTNEKSDDLG